MKKQFNHIGEILKSIREARGLSHRDIENLLKINKSQISLVENNNTVLPLDYVNRLHSKVIFTIEEKNAVEECLVNTFRSNIWKKAE